ncbi:MAG: DUF839 domain-containing protein, partial [Calditrichaeota bacterium]|nr:DUF839 domain-containing protein [Calditrichota bacterium]
LVKDPKGYLSLPSGFSYKVISRVGDTMSDGLLVPGKPDGMAAFAGSNGRTILVRNHEMNPNQTSLSPYGSDQNLLTAVDQNKIYDMNGGQPCLGGTSTLIYNHQTQEVELQYLSLAGTVYNCAGGPTPWKSWVTCEEFDKNDSIKFSSLEKSHGYCFEVPAREEMGLTDPVPLKALGRFQHEAICVDPDTGIVYLTEDDHDGLFYRFIPDVKSDLKAGGKLQALSLKDRVDLDIRNNDETVVKVGQELAVHWIDMDDIESPNYDLRVRGYQKGATRFNRGEGIWFGNNELFFTCTEGGAKHLGQIFKYKPAANEGEANESGGTLSLFLEPNDADRMKFCDNLTVSPWGDLIVCEDHTHSFLHGVTPKGELYHFAENIGSEGEFAGACFSPDGSTLFVNIQHIGETVAITGPWLS